MDAPAEPRARGRAPLLYLALVIVLAGRHLAIFYNNADFAHFDLLVKGLKALADRFFWVPSPELWETRFSLGGPLYYFVHYPATLLPNPVIGLHLYYAALELIGITAYLVIALRRRLMPPAVAWTAAFLLALATDAKLVVCENMSIAVFFAAPLYAALLAGLGQRRPWRATLALLPAGLLLGLTLAAHSTAAFLLPGVGLALLHRRNLLLTRLAALAAGVALVFVPSLGAIPPGEQGQLSEELARLLALFDPGKFLYLLVYHLPRQALPLAAALWLLAGRLRGADPAPELSGAARRLSLGWLLGGYLLFSAALVYLGINADESRYALLNPAGAHLGALLLVHLAHRLAARGPRLGRLLRPAPLALLLVALVSAHSAFEFVRSRRDFQRHLARARTLQRADARCTFPFWQDQTASRYMLWIQSLLERHGVPPIREKNIVVDGPWGRKVGALIDWMRLSGQIPAAAPGNRDEHHLLLLPPLAGFDAARLPGAIDYGPLTLVPNCSSLEVRSTADPRRFFARLPAAPRAGRRLLAASLVGEYGFDRPSAVRLWQGGEARAPLAAAQCHEAIPWVENYGGWLVFALDPGPGGEPLYLDVLHQKGELARVELLLLPDRGPAPQRVPQEAPDR